MAVRNLPRPSINRAAISSYVFRDVTGIVLGGLAVLVIAKTLGASGYGIFMLASSFVALAQLAGIPAKDVVRRFLPEFLAAGETARARALYARLTLLTVVVGGAIPTIVIGLAGGLIAGLYPEYTALQAALVALLPDILGGVLLVYVADLYYSVGRYGLSVGVGVISSAVYLGTAVALPLLGIRDVVGFASALAMGRLIVGLVFLGMSMIYMARLSQEAADADDARDDWRRCLNYYGALVVSFANWRGYLEVSRMVFALWLDARIIGVLSAVRGLVERGGRVYLAINATATPEIVAEMQNGDLSTASRLWKRYVHLSESATLASVAALMLLSQEAFLLLGGDEWQGGAALSSVYALSLLARGIGGVHSTWFFVHEDLRPLVVNGFFRSWPALGVSVVLIPWLGVWAVILADVLSAVVITGVTMGQALRRSHMSRRSLSATYRWVLVWAGFVCLATVVGWSPEFRIVRYVALAWIAFVCLERSGVRLPVWSSRAAQAISMKRLDRR